MNTTVNANAPFPQKSVCWFELDHLESKECIEHLSGWLTWLKERYALDHRALPECWAQHGALIEELSALASSWSRAFNTKETGYTPLAWHTDFALTRRRIADWIARSGCRPDEHRS